MNEFEKMINSEIYDPTEKTLLKKREQAKLLCFKYNTVSPDNTSEKESLIKKLFGKVGNGFLIEPSFYCDYGTNIEIGDNFYSNHNLVILDPAPVKFGNNVFIGPNCGFYTAEHPIDANTRILGKEYAKPIKVGNNVWFGGGCTILGGVTIGDNTVIGAGSVVTKDLPPNIVAAGNPCKVIKHLT